MRNFHSILFLALTLIPVSGWANQESEAEKRTKMLVQYIQDNWYEQESGLWKTTSWWNGANVLTALIKYASLTEDETIKKIIENTFDKTKKFEVPASSDKKAWICENYINDYYDDEGWWALAWLDAWEWTGNQKYLEMSKIIFKDITTGWDSTCGGGLYWKKGLSYKSSISNGLTMVLAARLHLAGTGNINGKSCLQWAMDIEEWMHSWDLINKDGLLQDGVSQRNGECTISMGIWTYNQGVSLSGWVLLHKITGREVYLKRAHKLARAAISRMVDANGILKELNCEPNNCNSDAEQFKGVFMRHLGVLNKYSPQSEYKTFIKNNANSIWVNAMEEGQSAPGVVWSSEANKINAATSSSALDALNAALELLK